MAKTNDYSKMMKDMMGNFPMDLSAFEDMFKTSAAFGEQMSKVALDAAGKSAELSTKWTQDTISKVADLTTAKEEAADYGKAISDFAAAQAESAAEQMAAFAEIAKKVQVETVELMLAAGKEAGEETAAAVKKATDEVSKAAKKATTAAK